MGNTTVFQAIARRVWPAAKDRFYLERLVGPVGYWDQLQHYQIQCAKNLGLQPADNLLDIGCGPLQGGIEFIRYLNPSKYTGLDYKTEPLEAAYKQLLKHNLIDKNPRLILSDTFGRNELDGDCYDFIWASQILYHLADDTLSVLFEELSHRLSEKGSFYGDIIGYPNKVTPTSSWNGHRFYIHELPTLQRIAEPFGLKVKAMGQIADLGYPQEIALKTNVMLQITHQ